MPPKKATVGKGTKKAAVGNSAPKKATAKATATGKVTKNAAGRKNAPKGAAAKPAALVPGPQPLPSPTLSVGPTWDASLRSLPANVKAAVDNGPILALNNNPIAFDNPQNWCYRNAVMTMLMYTPQLLGYIQRWHMQSEFFNHGYKDHVLQAMDDLTTAYHGTTKTRAADTEDAMDNLWQLFRGDPSTVTEFDGALPDPDDADQDDSASWLRHLLNEMEKQLTDAIIPGTADDSVDIFQAMVRNAVTVRTRCPGTQDGLCANPNQKERRPVEESPILDVLIPKGDNIALRDCIKHTLSTLAERWCDDCQKKGQNKKAVAANRHDREWRQIRDCPEALFMTLQRGVPVLRRGKRVMVKNLAAVAIPDVMDISEFLEYHNYGQGSVVRYELKAVVSHIGPDMGAGHYVVHVREGNNWWRVDDLATNNEVSASSIQRINLDGGGRTGKAQKGMSHPYLLSWVKVEEKILAPTRLPLKTADGQTNDGKPADGHDSKDSDPDDDLPAAAANMTDVKITVTIGDMEETIIVRRTLPTGIACHRSNLPPIYGNIRLVDDKANATQISFCNSAGRPLQQAANQAARDKAKPAAPKKPAGTKRKQDDLGDNIIDLTDDAPIDLTDDTDVDLGQKNPKRLKTGAQGGARGRP